MSVLESSFLSSKWQILFCLDQAPPPRPPLPDGERAPPRPPPPPETDDEDETMFKQAPLPNQPIMVSWIGHFGKVLQN